MDRAYIEAFRAMQAGLKSDLEGIDALIQALRDKHNEARKYERECYEEKVRWLDTLFEGLVRAEMARRATAANDLMELVGQKFPAGNGSDG